VGKTLFFIAPQCLKSPFVASKRYKSVKEMPLICDHSRQTFSSFAFFDLPMQILVNYDSFRGTEKEVKIGIRTSPSLTEIRHKKLVHRNKQQAIRILNGRRGGRLSHSTGRTPKFGPRSQTTLAHPASTRFDLFSSPMDGRISFATGALYSLSDAILFSSPRHIWVLSLVHRVRG